MPSPFPGMDPYIEASGYFSEFHTSLIVEMRTELNKRLPRGFAASLDIYVWIHEPTALKRRRRLEPDVYIREERRRKRAGGKLAVNLPPMTITLPAIERRKKRYLKIEDIESNRVVTAIEILSPGNKDAEEDRDTYLAKRGEYLAAHVNLVEMDLLRGGTRLPLSHPSPPTSDYYIMVCKDWEFPRAGFWTFGLRDAVPDIPIPLARGVSDVVLPVARCMRTVYEEGRFEDKLKYGRPLTPPLDAKDAAWVRTRLVAKGIVRA